MTEASSHITLGWLWRRFWPLSLSDVVMTAGDPLQSMALTRLPDPQLNLAAIGIVKALANFVESPIIMVLHASTALTGSNASRRSLARFVCILALALTALFALLAWPPLYRWTLTHGYEADATLSARAFPALVIMLSWPAVIAWRRYYQGMLIRHARGRYLAWASAGRLLALVSALVLGLHLQGLGAVVAAASLMVSLLVEALLVTAFAVTTGATAWKPESDPHLPASVPAVARYYAPLAQTMLLVWGGRAALVALVARAVDAPVALAAWPAAWGFVLLVGNSTRMVQQLIIAHERETTAGLLLRFTGLVGLGCSGLLAALSFSQGGQQLLLHMLGGDAPLVSAALPVLQLGSLCPILIALQNAHQGYGILRGRNRHLQRAALAGIVLTLSVTCVLIRFQVPGALAAMLGMVVGLAAEVLYLTSLRNWRNGPASVD